MQRAALAKPFYYYRDVLDTLNRHSSLENMLAALNKLLRRRHPFSVRGSWFAGSLLWAIVLSGCGTVPPSAGPPCVSVAPASEHSSESSAVVQLLRRQLREQDERIGKLQSRLDALKLIEEDRQTRKRLRLRQSTIIPPE